MGSLRFLALFALLLSIFFAVSANTSNDATHAKDEVKPSEATDVIEPQQRGGCRYDCCGSYIRGRCSACCSQPQAAKPEANSQPQATEAVEAETVKADVVEPQQGSRGGGGCRYGCCGKWRFGRCTYCCSRRQAEADVVEPQQRGGCWFGCCGSYMNGQCSACCLKKMDTEEDKKKGEAKP